MKSLAPWPVRARNTFAPVPRRRFGAGTILTSQDATTSLDVGKD
ncbi:hypothetical protein [Nonomuraea dietziae]